MTAMADPTTQPAIDPEDEDRARHQRAERTPTGKNLLGPFSVVCLVLNRTIGSGIFVTPAVVVGGTGSAGGSLMLWAFGGIITTCGLMVWLQLGLSLPLLPTGSDRRKRAVPRSGGEKNYLEFIYGSEATGRPRLLVKCMYGIAFVLLGNLSGNAIAFGIYAMSAAGYPDASKGSVIGLAIGALSLTVVLHMVSRRAGIYLNNVFAVLKVAVMLAIIVLGFIRAAGNNLGGQPKATSNFDVETSFEPGAAEVPSVAVSLTYILYAYSGFEQPFYVLAEVRKPRKVFPTYTLVAMGIVIALFLLVNVAYFCTVPRDLPALREQRNMATVFFGQMFGDETAKRAMDGIIAAAIFGNLLVMTYTASRVKQEIAKEGILPRSLTFATSRRTLDALLQSRRRRKGQDGDEVLEQSPMAALGLHLFTSVLLIALTSMLDPSIAYAALAMLYSYVIIILNGFFTSFGLLYLKIRRSADWRTPNFNPRCGAVYAAVYCVACFFMICASLASPSDGSPYAYAATRIQPFLLPVIGVTVPFWGMVWYGGMRLLMAKWDRELVVVRNPTTTPVPGMPDQYIMTAELITHDWHVRGSHGAADPADDTELNTIRPDTR